MYNNKRVLVFGGKGQLGQCLYKVTQDKATNNSFKFLGEQDGNILDLDILIVLFTENKIDFVINCAAYTAVDKAEDEFERCDEINRIGAANLAKLCAEFKVKLIHISTDFVFEGEEPKLLNETDVTQPVNVYGKTKLMGELEIAKLLKEHYIIRTSWLYSEYANNFVKVMRKLGTERDELNVVVDQIGTPTYAIDLAELILNIIELDNNAYGIYHYSNEGVTSWYDFAKNIFDISNLKIKVNPIPGIQYPTKAKRPAFSVMNKAKVKHNFKISIPHWRDSLITCIHNLQNT